MTDGRLLDWWKTLQTHTELLIKTLETERNLQQNKKKSQPKKDMTVMNSTSLFTRTAILVSNQWCRPSGPQPLSGPLPEKSRRKRGLLIKPDLEDSPTPWIFSVPFLYVAVTIDCAESLQVWKLFYPLLRKNILFLFVPMTICLLPFIWAVPWLLMCMRDTTMHVPDSRNQRFTASELLETIVGHLWLVGADLMW